MDQQMTNPMNGGTYVDPIATNGTVEVEAKPEKKQGKAAGILTIVGTVLLYKLFGIIGGAICLAGAAVVGAIVKSKMSTAVKVILSILTIVGFLILLFAFILLSAAIFA